MANQLTRGERLQIMLTAEELKALDDWRFKQRMPSRASAVDRLMSASRRAEGFAPAEQGQKSEDFGVTDGTARAKRKLPPVDGADD